MDVESDFTEPTKEVVLKDNQQMMEHISTVTRLVASNPVTAVTVATLVPMIAFAILVEFDQVGTLSSSVIATTCLLYMLIASKARGSGSPIETTTAIDAMTTCLLPSVLVAATVLKHNDIWEPGFLLVGGLAMIGEIFAGRQMRQKYWILGLFLIQMVLVVLTEYVGDEFFTFIPSVEVIEPLAVLLHATHWYYMVGFLVIEAFCLAIPQMDKLIAGSWCSVVFSTYQMSHVLIEAESNAVPFAILITNIVGIIYYLSSKELPTFLVPKRSIALVAVLVMWSKFHTLNLMLFLAASLMPVASSLLKQILIAPSKVEEKLQAKRRKSRFPVQLGLVLCAFILSPFILNASATVLEDLVVYPQLDGAVITVGTFIGGDGLPDVPSFGIVPSGVAYNHNVTMDVSFQHRVNVSMLNGTRMIDDVNMIIDDAVSRRSQLINNHYLIFDDQLSHFPELNSTSRGLLASTFNSSIVSAFNDAGAPFIERRDQWMNGLALADEYPFLFRKLLQFRTREMLDAAGGVVTTTNSLRLTDIAAEWTSFVEPTYEVIDFNREQYEIRQGWVVKAGVDPTNVTHYNNVVDSEEEHRSASVTLSFKIEELHDMLKAQPFTGTWRGQHQEVETKTNWGKRLVAFILLLVLVIEIDVVGQLASWNSVSCTVFLTVIGTFLAHDPAISLLAANLLILGLYVEKERDASNVHIPARSVGLSRDDVAHRKIDDDVQFN